MSFHKTVPSVHKTPFQPIFMYKQNTKITKYSTGKWKFYKIFIYLYFIFIFIYFVQNINFSAYCNKTSVYAYSSHCSENKVFACARKMPNVVKWGTIIEQTVAHKQQIRNIDQTNKLTWL